MFSRRLFGMKAATPAPLKAEVRALSHKMITEPTHHPLGCGWNGVAGGVVYMDTFSDVQLARLRSKDVDGKSVVVLLTTEQIRDLGTQLILLADRFDLQQ